MPPILFSLDTSAVSFAATQLGLLASDGVLPSAVLNDDSSSAILAAATSAAMAAPGGGAVAQFLSAATTALATQGSRVAQLSAYGDAAAVALQDLVLSSSDAEASQAQRFSSTTVEV